MYVCVYLCLCVQLWICMSNETQRGIAAICLLLHPSTLLFFTKQLQSNEDFYVLHYFTFWAAYFVLLLGSHLNIHLH